jgi:hypothetical protein
MKLTGLYIVWLSQSFEDLHRMRFKALLLVGTTQALLLFLVTLGCEPSQQEIARQELANDVQNRLCGSRVSDACKVAALEGNGLRKLAIKYDHADPRLWALLISDSKLRERTRAVGYDQIVLGDGELFWRTWNVGAEPKLDFQIPGDWSKAQDRHPIAAPLVVRTVSEAHAKCKTVTDLIVTFNGPSFKAEALVCPDGNNLVALTSVGETNRTECLIDNYGRWTIRKMSVAPNGLCCESLEIEYSDGNSTVTDSVDWNDRLHAPTIFNFSRAGPHPISCE